MYMMRACVYMPAQTSTHTHTHHTMHAHTHTHMCIIGYTTYGHLHSVTHSHRLAVTLTKTTIVPAEAASEKTGLSLSCFVFDLAL